MEFEFLECSKVYEIIIHTSTRYQCRMALTVFRICVVRVGFQHPHNTTDDSAGAVS